jgi:D-aminopeptidase
VLIALSVDMEGASQLRSMREIWGCLPEYWETGRPRQENDVRAAGEGLLAGGASQLVVLDNHGGNTVNVSPEALPERARLESWRCLGRGIAPAVVHAADGSTAIRDRPVLATSLPAV